MAYVPEKFADTIWQYLQDENVGSFWNRSDVWIPVDAIVNAITGHAYSGLNVLMAVGHYLKAQKGIMPYNIMAYIPKGQITGKSARKIKVDGIYRQRYVIKKGASGVLMQYWNIPDAEKLKEYDEQIANGDDSAKKPVPWMRYFYAYPIEYLNFTDKDEEQELLDKWAINGNGPLVEDADIKASFTAWYDNMPSHPSIQYIPNENPAYLPLRDLIVLPAKDQFTSQIAYLTALLHELGHSTGHSTRMDRDLSGEFGSKKYALEELVAQLLAFFIRMHIRVIIDPDVHKNDLRYINNWGRVFNAKEYRLMFSVAASMAYRAYLWTIKELKENE